MKSFHDTICVVMEVLFSIKAFIKLLPQDFKASEFCGLRWRGRLVSLLSLLLMCFSFGETPSIVLPVHHALLLKVEVKIHLLCQEKGNKFVLNQK